MVKLVGICVALFLLAAGVVIVTQTQDLAALFGAFRAESLLGKAAWAIVVVVPIILLPTALRARRLRMIGMHGGNAAGHSPICRA